MSTTRLNSAREALKNHNYTYAIEQYQGLLAQKPDDASLYLELSSCMIGINQIDEALVIAKQAQLHASKPFRLHCDLQIANIYLSQDRYAQAGQLFHSILTHQPQTLEARIGLSKLYLETGEPSKAHAILQAAAPSAQEDANWAISMSLALFKLRKADEAIALTLDYMNAHGAHPILLSNALMSCSYTHRHAEFQPQLQKFMQQAYPPAEAVVAHHTKKPKGKPLKIGFVSGDFSWHPVGYFFHSFLPHLRDHDIKTTLYSNNPRNDSLTELLRNAAHEFKPIHHLDTQAATELIRKDGLDILIDLSGHSAGHRMDVFHQRAAPIQATYLGYTESTHIKTMDYIFTDQHHVHVSEHEQYSEKVIYFPTTRFCFRLPMDAPDILPAPMETNGYLTLGSFSNPAKISGECVALWGQILCALPHARLKLRHKHWDDDALRQSLLNELKSIGVAQGRIEFYGEAKYNRYLAAYQEVDVILDTSPFSGGTTTCEALWMGVPVLTCAGQTPASRQGVSILNAVNEPAWIVDTAEQAIHILKQLADSPDIMSEFKLNIRHKFLESPLGNGQLFAQQFLSIALNLSS